MCHIYITHFEQPDKMKHTTEHNVGLTLLSRALSDLYGIEISPDTIEEHVEKNEYGKPYLKDYPHIHYNISHADDIAICAIGTQTIGADVEKMHDFNNAILRKVFTVEEKAFFQQMAIDESASQEWFFRFWTLKESRIKHAGTGLSMSLTNFSFTFELDTDADLGMNSYAIHCSDKDVHFKQQVLENNYVLSVCTSTPIEELNLIYI